MDSRLDAGLDGLQRGLQRGWHLAGEVVDGESTTPPW